MFQSSGVAVSAPARVKPNKKRCLAKAVDEGDSAICEKSLLCQERALLELKLQADQSSLDEEDVSSVRVRLLEKPVVRGSTQLWRANALVGSFSAFHKLCSLWNSRPRVHYTETLHDSEEPELSSCDTLSDSEEPELSFSWEVREGGAHGKLGFPDAMDTDELWYNVQRAQDKELITKRTVSEGYTSPM